MPGEHTPLLNVDPKENIAPDQAKRLSRSPHPYHRTRVNVLQDNDTAVAQNAVFSPTLNFKSPESKGEASYFDADHRKRRKETSSPSDSGSEADDEKGGSLLRLPAPPARLRKGLKGSNGSGRASPLLTPSYLDEGPRKLAQEARQRPAQSFQDQSYTDEETIKLRQKFVRRRRAELIRRVSETLLLGVVGFIACKNETEWLLRSWAESLDSANAGWDFDSVFVPMAFLVHATVILSLYILYPIRIILNNHSRNALKKRSRFYIHIPAAFEPAPLLYPILVPVFVGLSLMPVDGSFLVANLALSIASVPSKIVLLNLNVPWYNSIQWLLTLAPIQACLTRCLDDCQPHMELTHSMLKSFNAEGLVMLYPLHQALMPALGYLTTTSLLPAELQLLSVSMINLLIHSSSPQALILQSLLWVGGLSIFILCGRVLSWGVALARIPSWRFRQPNSRAREDNVIMTAFDDCLYGRLRKWRMTSVDYEDSESDDLERHLKIRPRRKQRPLLNVDTYQIEEAEDRMLPELSKASQSAIGNGMQAGPQDPNGAVRSSQANTKRQRRNTLQSYVGSPSGSSSKEVFKRSRIMQFQPLKSWSFRSLTKAQAVVVKWMFAFYVYTIVVTIIAFGVRPYVGRRALHDQEPVGWALGYLFGDLAVVRSHVMNWNLGSWIRLPQAINYSSSSTVLEWVNRYQYGLGSANVRLLICIYCSIVITVGLAVVFRLSAVAEVDTRRKVFHGMMVAMFLPTIFVDPPFVSLAFVLILAIFLLLDLFRASQLPPLSKPLTYFLAPYVDGRDHRGPVIVSHIFLLIGCAIPLWLSLAATQRTGYMPWEGWDVDKREVSMVSGVVCVGMGDAAASLIGRRFGRRRWCWSGGKSLEGSLAFAVAVVLGLCFARIWLLIGGWANDYRDFRDSWTTTVGKACVAATGASLTEAVLTGGNDNVIVPIILWLLVRGLRI